MRFLLQYFVPFLIACGLGVGPGLAAPVSAGRIEKAASDPKNWLTYGGAYNSQRNSGLTQINASNVKQLELKWVQQDEEVGNWENNPLVVDGVMYVTERPNQVVAMDAKTGRIFWDYHYAPSADTKVCCGAENRGLAILGDTLYMGTIDAHLVAIDARNGRPLWDVTVADTKQGYSVTLAPLVVKDKIVIGVGGGELAIRGFVAAYDAKTGKEAWRFNTIPGPGEPGHETWTEDAWAHGGAPAWITGSYDPSLNLIYWGIGNPWPDWTPAQRPGDNLYSDSVVALDADTGSLKWHFQFTPNDSYDYDSVQIPVLVDMNWKGKPSKLMMWANRNGFFYVLDRVTGKFLLGEPYIKVNWASGLDPNGRPIQTPQPAGMPTWPGVNGGTDWYPPAYNPRTGLFYFTIWENYAAVYRRTPKPGGGAGGGGFSVLVGPAAATPEANRVVPPRPTGLINSWADDWGNGAVIAINPVTGKRAWTFHQFGVTDAGVLTTASNLVFSGGREGYFYALDAKTGKLLWKVNLGGSIAMAPVTYQVDGKQYVSVIAGGSLFTFALRD
jgi:alcohol dehydrogenase (cytochrome c)